MQGPKTKMELQSVTASSDGLGGMTHVWAKVIDITGVLTFPYRLQGGETFTQERRTVKKSLVFFCDMPSTIPTEKDRFVRDTHTYEITQVYNPGNMDHHLEIWLFEIM
jgi:hypothetical protein